LLFQLLDRSIPSHARLIIDSSLCLSLIEVPGLVFEDILENQLIVLCELTERPPRGVTVRKWILLDPSTARVLVKVFTGIDCCVERIDDRCSSCDALR